MIRVTKNTWRQALRNPLTGFLWVILVILTIFCAMTTTGSPNAGAGAMKIFAIAYSVAPFAVVLIVGQIGRKQDTQAIAGSEPASQSTFFIGQTIGHFAVGLVLVLSLGVIGGVAMALFCHYAIITSLLWNIKFALLTVPSLVTLLGLSLLLLQVFGEKPRYFAVSIVLSLIIAFTEYKLPALSHAVPTLNFWNPFPGFLTSSPALPPSLLAAPFLSLWLLENRIVYVLLGLLLLTIAMVYPTSPRPYRQTSLKGSLTMLIILVGCLVFSVQSVAAAIATIAPSVFSPLAQASYLHSFNDIGQAGTPHIRLTIDARTGLITGSEAIPVTRRGHALTFFLNASLMPNAILYNGRQVPFARPSMNLQVIQGTAAEVWQAWPTGLPKHGLLTVDFQGTMLPKPSLFAYPPFSPGQVYDALYAGHGRVFLTGTGTYIPVPLTASPLAAATLANVQLTLHIEHLSQTCHVITNLQKTGNAYQFDGNLNDAVFLTTPYVTGQNGADRNISTRQSLLEAATWTTYAKAWQAIYSVLPDAQSHLIPVYSPVTDHTLLTGNLLVVSEAVTRPMTAPTFTSAQRMLAQKWWAAHWITGNEYFGPFNRTQAMYLATVLATVDALKWQSVRTTVSGAQETAIVRQSLPGLAPLSLAQQRMVTQIWQVVQPMSLATWKKTEQNLSHQSVSSLLQVLQKKGAIWLVQHA